MKTQTIRKSRYINGGMKFYKAGGIQYMNGGLPKYGMRNKFQSGGSIYDDNTVQAAGQGAAGSTANIVFQETGPELQETREKSLTEQSEVIESSGAELENTLKEEEAQSKVDIETAKQKTDAKFDTASTAIKTGVELGKKSGFINKNLGSLGVGTAMTAYKAQKAINLGKKGYEGIKAGVQTSKQLAQSVKAAKLAKKSGTLLMYGQKGSEAGSAVASGLSALNNVNVYSAAANYAGKGIKSLSDDNDATTWTAGEATGDILGTAGEYAGYGAMLGSAVPVVGNAVGAAVGGIVGAGVGIYKGLTGRNKAREAEEKAKKEQAAKVKKYNKEVSKTYASQKARVNSGAMKQKTYSGYDLGQNVVARKGGYRNIPQYI